MKTEAGLLVAAASVSGVMFVPMVGPWHWGAEFLDSRIQMYAAGFGVVWTGYRSFVFWRAWRRWSSWRRPASWSVKPTELHIESARGRLPRVFALEFHSYLRRTWAKRLYADKGILIGRGFRWGPEHTQELEDHLQGGQALPVGRDVRGGHPALHAVGKKSERPLVLPWSELVGHVLIGGTTRSGKTRLLELIVAEAIRGPGTVIIIDPKGDAELLIRTAAECYRMGREFAFFSPAHAEQSASFNPFSMCKTTTELAARVQALMPGGGGMAKGDPFFTEYPLAVVERLGAAQHAVGDGWTIEGLYAVTTMVPPFDDLVARYLYRVLGGRDNHTPPLEEVMEEYAAKRRVKQDPLADALVDDKEKPRDHFVQVTANLVPAFRGVTGDKMAGLLSSEDPDLTWDGVVEQRKVVYFAMSSLLYGEVANRIGRVILQDLIGFLGRRYAEDDPARMTPLTILVDEFSNVAYPGFIDALNKGGGAKANIMLAMQSLADPEAAMGKDGTQRVLDNLNTTGLVSPDGRRDGEARRRGPGDDECEPRGHHAQPEFRRWQFDLGRIARSGAVRRPAADSPGMDDGTAARRGIRADAGRELEAAGTAAGTRVEDGAGGSGRALRAVDGYRGAEGGSGSPGRRHEGGQGHGLGAEVARGGRGRWRFFRIGRRER